MLEIEMKFRVANAAEYERLISETLGASFGEPTVESDVFFTNEALGFPNEGKSLRIRRRGNYLAATFKGPRLDSQTKTREELELTLVDERPELSEENARRVDEARANWIRFYERLGFSRYGVVTKRRRRASTEYGGRQFEITLDEIDGLGVFTELEVSAEKDEFVDARAVVMLLAQKLGLRETVTASYLSMVCAQDRKIAEWDAK